MLLHHDIHSTRALAPAWVQDNNIVVLNNCQDASPTSPKVFSTQVKHAYSPKRVKSPEIIESVPATTTSKSKSNHAVPANNSHQRRPTTSATNRGISRSPSLASRNSAGTPLSFDHLSLTTNTSVINSSIDKITTSSHPVYQNNEALSSLINSLTSISNAQRVRTPDFDRRPKSAGHPSAGRDSIVDSFEFSPELRRAFDQAQDRRSPPPAVQSPGYGFYKHDDIREDEAEDREANANDDEEDNDACPPPVAGYNTINAVPADTVRPKTAGSAVSGSNRTSSIHSKTKSLRGKLKSVKSHANIKTSKPRRDLQTPESYQSSHYTRSSFGNASFVSAQTSSINSDPSARRPSLKMFFSTRLGNEQDHLHQDLSSTSPIHAVVTESRMSTPEKEKDNDTRRFSAFVAVSKIPLDRTGRRDTDTGTLASLSPTLRSDLSDNLIPSRRSSLRGGPEAKSARNSRDLRSLNIDQDLIEANNGTVQRIKELQEARDKRHSEWRREARKSEKAASKRLSAPNSQSSSPTKSRSGPGLVVRSSWQSNQNATDSVKAESNPQLSATLKGHELSEMPAFVEAEEAYPITPPARDDRPNGFEPSLRRNASVAGSTSPSTRSGTVRHRKKLSDSLRRVSLRPTTLDDGKCVQDEVEAYLGSPRLTQKIRHPRTGRTIAFSEVGDPSGFVVFCCVGMGLTRYVSSFYDDIAHSHKLRIITPDRPGVGETEALPPERTTPLSWVDDVAVICSSLGIEKFSLLAHSAGAIYALATALKMPQYVRGRIHLLAPWIPPSVLAVSGKQGNSKPVNLPTSHKLLSLLPVSFMKAANSRFLSSASASLEPRSSRERKNDAAALELGVDAQMFNQGASLSTADFDDGHMLRNPDSISSSDINGPLYNVRSPPRSPTPSNAPYPRSMTLSPTSTSLPVTGSRSTSRQATLPVLSPETRQRLYNTTLAHRTWDLATLNANPAQDLVICLERKKAIGFRYTDITRAVVIHHGANDTRVPLDNVDWLSKTMKRCELRVLETEGHGLMASASVMANVLTEIAKEWEEWSVITSEKEKDRKKQEQAEEKAAQERERAFRRGYPKW